MVDSSDPPQQLPPAALSMCDERSEHLEPGWSYCWGPQSFVANAFRHESVQLRKMTRFKEALLETSQYEPPQSIY